MSEPIIQAQYDSLEEIAKRFDEQANRTEEASRHIIQMLEQLEGGGWEGDSAQGFFREMNDEVIPTTNNLREAFTEAGETTRQIMQVIQTAEEEAANQFQITNEGGEAPDKGFFGHAGDFFSGVYAEGKDAVTGLWTMVRHPIQTGKGLWHGIKNPGELWNAIKEPYVEDWNNGRPWRAVGRGTLAIVTTVFGAKGADKAAKAAKGSRVSSAAQLANGVRRIARTNVDDFLQTVGRSSDEASQIGRNIADNANAGRNFDSLTDDLARQSAHAVDTVSGEVPERVVLGAWKDESTGVTNYYLREAYENGGIVYSTGDEAWDAVSKISNEVTQRQVGWDVNRKFLQNQLDANVPRLEYVSDDLGSILKTYEGRSYDDIAREFVEDGIDSVNNERISYRHLEVLYLRDNAPKLGYELIDNVWVKQP